MVWGWWGWFWDGGYGAGILDMLLGHLGWLWEVLEYWVCSWDAGDSLSMSRGYFILIGLKMYYKNMYHVPNFR
jgi:hypothetical protein